MMHLLKQQDYQKMPWKNGKGVTQEIIKVNQSNNEDSFLWRLSIADITEDGAFSIFSGYQRIISVLEGNGMVLEVAGEVSRPLLKADPFAFAGDAVVNSRLLAGALRDFNLIYDPYFIKARLQWFTVGDKIRFFTDAEQLVIFNAGSPLSVQIAGESSLLNHYDTVWNTATLGLQEVILATQSLSCCVIELYSKNTHDIA